MPKLIGIRSRQYQVYYDSLVNAKAGEAANPTVMDQQRLFNGTNLGLYHWTNMATSSTFPTDNTFLAIGMSVTTHLAGQLPGDERLLYEMLMGHMRVTLCVGDMPQFNAFASELVFPNDEIQTSMRELQKREPKSLKRIDNLVRTVSTEYMVGPYHYFEKPITIPARQSFCVLVDIIGPHKDDVKDGLNKAWGCWRNVKVNLPGIHTRDVL